MKDKEYYESLDKRSKEYKEWKKNYDNAPEGLGDVIEKVTEVTGVKKLVKKVFGDDCGCKERKAKANDFIRFKPVNCFTEQEFIAWTEFRERENPNTLTYAEQQFVNDMHESIFKRNTKLCSGCGGAGRLKGFIENLNEFYESYLN